MMTNLEDTKPRSPFNEKPLLNDEEPQPSSGPGCMVWGLMGAFALGFALIIVFLAGTAGWTEGQRIADRHATATQSELIGQQLVRIPTDVAEGNSFNLNRRLSYLETVAPNVAGIAEIRVTATSLYLTSQPTITPTPTQTATPTVTQEQPEVTEEPTVAQATPLPGGVSVDLVALLQQARDQIAAGQYADAQDTLDIIIRVDSSFQQETVGRLMYEALTVQATRLFRSEETLAEAIRLTDLAEEYGPISQSDLNYERLIAGLYLDAQRAIGTGDHGAAIRAINQLLNYQSSYLNVNFNRLLFDEYVAYAEAWEFGEQYCQAVQQYNNALALFNDNTVVAQRDNAQNLCLSGTPIPGAEGTLPPVGGT